MEFLKKRRARLTPMRSYSFALTVKVAERGGGAGDVTWWRGRCRAGGATRRRGCHRVVGQWRWHRFRGSVVRVVGDGGDSNHRKSLGAAVRRCGAPAAASADSGQRRMRMRRLWPIPIRRRRSDPEATWWPCRGRGVAPSFGHMVVIQNMKTLFLLLQYVQLHIYR
jgi:hypothetical protein